MSSSQKLIKVLAILLGIGIIISIIYGVLWGIFLIFRVNFSDINNVTLNTKNNGSIKLSSSILSSLDSNSIPKNSTIVKEFMFDIGFEQQGDISGFTFSNVMYGASNITLNVVF